MNQVLSILTGLKVEDTRSVIEQGFLDKNQSTAGCYIKTQSVHSISRGVVLAIEKDPKNLTWTVTVEVNSHKWVRYCCLSAVKVLTGIKINVNDSIGYADRGLMRLEYCTNKKTKFPVRITSRQLYKCDPTPIIFGQEILTEGF